jgi:GTP cyclohydrolase II
MDPRAAPLVRIHSECITADVFGSLRCDCGAQLDRSIRLLQAEGGILLYLRQEGRGIGLLAKIDAYRLQDQGLDTYDANRALAQPADAREYACGADMLRAMGVARIRLMTNNPDKVAQLGGSGIAIVERVTGVSRDGQVGQAVAKALAAEGRGTRDHSPLARSCLRENLSWRWSPT